MAESPNSKKRDSIEYIRKDIPSIALPEYRGETYEALVPDTPDVEERAKLAIHGLFGPTDPEADHMLYFYVWLLHNPPMMQHGFADTCIAKFWESLPLMRVMNGSDLHLPIEKRWMEIMLQTLGPDGLPYFSLKGQQWLRNGMEIPINMPDTYDICFVNQHPTLARQLGAISLYYMLTADDTWKHAGQGIVNGLIKLAIDKGDYAYFPGGNVFPGVRTRDAKMPTGEESGYPGWTIQGLIQYYRATGYEPALVLSGKLARYIRYYGGYYDAQAGFIPHITESGQSFNHFHRHTIGLLGMLEYAIAADDQDLIEYVRKGYEHGKANGNVIVGHFPEYIGWPERMNSEICEVADMIALGIKLTQAGAGDYWDDVDRWVRNQFIEGQLVNVDWVYQNTKDLPLSPIDESWQTTDRVPERNLGVFAGWPSANDYYGGLEGNALSQDNGVTIQHCCTGNGTRALYYVWENIIHHLNGRLRINLLLNRASSWADIDSHIPYIGQVDIKMKQSTDLEIRIPEWVEPKDVRVTINGLVYNTYAFDGRYLQTGIVKARDIVTVSFPLDERNEQILVNGKQYSIVRKGNDVVYIDPPGRYCPLYQREHYRSNQTIWKNITRFISDKIVDW